MAKSKSTIRGLALAVLLCGLLAGKASAGLITETFHDTWINFPGWDNPLYPNDTIGNPQISKMAVTFDETTRLLNSVSIHLTNRLTWDSLFINADWAGDWASYDQWDHYVFSNRSKDVFYNVIDPTNYTYTLSLTPSTRIGHPNAIATADLTSVYVGYQALSTGLTSYDGSVLTYSLASFGIILGDRFMIAYSPWCANDVIGSAIPEPATMLLFGAGLVGLAGVARRRMRVA